MDIGKALLISSSNEIRYAKRNSSRWQFFLPGHQQIEEILKRNGLRVFSPRSIPDAAYIDVQNQVAEVLAEISPKISDDAPSLKIFLLEKLLQALQRYYLEIYILKNHSIELSRLDNRGEIDCFWKDSTVPRKNTSFLSGAFGIPKSSYIIDFQSPSALAGGAFSSPYPVKRIVTNKYSLFLNPKLDRTKYINLFLKERKISPVSPIDLKFLDTDQKFARALEANFKKIQEDYIFFYSEYKSLLQSRPPEEAWFNVVKDVRMAAAMTALKDLGVANRFQSHGGMHVFGSDAQCQISALLSESHFNGFPAARFLHPRGPLQEIVPRSDQKLVRSIGRVALSQSDGNAATRRTQFRIAFIPSYISWHSNFWGLANSCYDTFNVAKYLLELAPSLRDTEVRFRLRGQRDKHLKGSRRRVMTGIDFAPLKVGMDNCANVLDCSGHDYDELLEWADLIITEGITAVTYDSLEKRKPVLSLRGSEKIRGSFAAKHPSVVECHKRRALYSADISDFSKVDISFLSRKHMGKPLVDEELRGTLYL